MKAKRRVCLALCLCLLLAAGLGCVRSAEPSESVEQQAQSAEAAQPSPEPVEQPTQSEEAAQPSPESDSAAPTERPDRTPDADPASIAPLYEGDGLKIYYASRLGQPGICVEAQSWDKTYSRFQRLPFTDGLTELVFTGIETKPVGDRAEALMYLRYLDRAGTERIICADHSKSEYTVVYPLSTEAGLELTEEQRGLFDDLLLIGYLYERIYAEADRLSDPDGWESLCQRRILDALYYNCGDVLPPYLKGEGTIDGNVAIVSQEELEDFFQSTVGRPCLVQDRQHMPYDEPWEELLPGQVPMPETDYYFEGYVRQAIKEADGTICLYGTISGFELLYLDVVCRIRPVDGYLGGQVISTEVFPVYYMHNDPSIALLKYETGSP